MNENDRKSGSQFDTVATLVLEYLDRKQQGDAVDVDAYLGQLDGQEQRAEFTRLLGLYDRVDKHLTDASPMKSGTVLGDFRIIDPLGRGGMGVVYLAEQVSLKRRVALKILPQHLIANERALERFRREILALARLRHRNLVQVYDAGTHEGTPYFVMEYVEGRTLHEVFDALRDQHPDSLTGACVRRLFAGAAETAFPAEYIETVVRIVIGVADALHYAHESGVLHRDVKPQNILIGNDGTPLLFDFGLAREEGAVTLTRTGELAGSPYYVAPEQVRKAPRGGSRGLDRRVDVYALGVTLHEALTLRVPFEGDSTEQVLRAIGQGDAPSIRKRNPLVDPALERVCRKAMDRDPRWRYATAKEFADDLRRCLAREPVAPVMPSANVRAARWAERHPATIMIGAVVVLSVCAWGGMQWKRIVEAKAIAASQVDSAAAKIAELLAMSGDLQALERRLRPPERAFEEYLTRAEHEAQWADRLRLDVMNTNRDRLRYEVRTLLDLAHENDPKAARLKTLRMELDWLEAKTPAVRKEVEHRILTTEEGEPIRFLATLPGRLSITVAPADAEASLFRFLEQSDIKAGGEPRLVPVPWRGPETAWPADAAFQPGDSCVVVNAVQEDGVALNEGVAPGDLLLEINGRALAGGVYVIAVDDPGEARAAGLRPGDRLISIGDFDVSTPYDVSAAVLAERVAKAGPRPKVVWESQDGQRKSASVLVSGQHGVASGSVRLGAAGDLVARAELPAPARLRMLSVGSTEPREIDWPAHTRLGVDADLTAFPLLFVPGARLSPGKAVELDPGSYLVVARRHGSADLRFPVVVTSGGDTTEAIEMVGAEDVPPGYLYIAPSKVPVGEADSGQRPFVKRFWIARCELTVREYFEFLNSSELQGELTPDILTGKTPSRFPREVSGRFFNELQMPLRPPFSTREPDDLPVSGISQEDARRYCTWLTEKHRASGGQGTFRLPTVDEWEKAARGADERWWSFGNYPDTLFARLQNSCAEARTKAPVGAFLRDESPFGVRDLTGNVMEWVDRENTVAGGSYGMPTPWLARVLADKFTNKDRTQPQLGFRLVWVPDESE